MEYIVQPVFTNSLHFPGKFAAKKYAVAVMNSGKMLTHFTHNQRIFQSAWKDSPAQHFLFESLGDGSFKMVIAGTDRVVTKATVEGANTPGLVATPWNGSNEQRWKLEARGGSTFRISSVSGGNMHIPPDWLTTDGAGIHVYPIPASKPGALIWDFRLTEVLPNTLDRSMRATAAIFEHGGFDGVSQDLGPGSFKSAQLRFGGISSVRVPEGLRLTLHKSDTFDGDRKAFDGDVDYVGDDWNDQAVAVVVEPVVTVYDQAHFAGSSQRLTMGQHDAAALTIGDDAIRSVKVPAGMMIELYSDPEFKGESVVITSDAPDLGDFIDRVSSAMVKITGTAMPERPLRFGDRISLTAQTGSVLRLRNDEVIEARSGLTGEETFFTIVRAGPTMNLNYVAFGDVVALRATNGKYMTFSGPTRANVTTIGDGEKWVIFRVGETDTRTFVAVDDVVGFRRAFGNTFLTDGHASGQSWNDRTAIEAESRFELRPYGDPLVGQGDGSFVAPVCGAQEFTVAICGADMCPVAVCGAQYAIVNACDTAAVGVAICAVDIAGVSACGALVKGITACGGNLCGVAACAVAACGADACGGAACGAAACGGAACGGNGCGGNACAVDACPANACGANACGGNACAVAVATVCPIAACGGNVCAIDLCPADLCAADACAIDVIPIIPGI